MKTAKMNNSIDWSSYEGLKQIIFVIMISMFGALAKAISSTDDQKVTMKRVITGMITGGFTGIMTFYLISELNFGEGVKAFIYGMSGFSGQAVLIGYEKKLLKIINKNTEALNSKIKSNV